jgi:hypothetical protein
MRALTPAETMPACRSALPIDFIKVIAQLELSKYRKTKLMAMLIDPDLSGVNIVLIGRFNPSIFQPYWFSAQELISDEAANSAQISVIHPEVTAFVIDSLFGLQVTQDRFAIDRSVAPLILVSDLTVRIFSVLLPHTPIGRLGINRSVHFKVKDAATREKIGQTLAPREPWGEFGKKVSSGSGSKHGGLQSLTLIQREVEGRSGGWIQAKVEPSARLGFSETGIYVEVNDHFEISNWTSPKDAIDVIQILDAKFDESLVRSESIINQIMGLGL